MTSHAQNPVSAALRRRPPLRGPRSILLGVLLLPFLAACALQGGEPWDEPLYATDLYAQALRADLLQNQGDYEAAERITSELLELEPDFVPAWRLRQEYLRTHGHVAQAWAELRELRQRYGENPVTHYLEGRLLADARKQGQHFLQGLMRWPDSFWLRYASNWSLSNRPETSPALAARLLLPSALDSRVPWAPISVRMANLLKAKSPDALRERLRELHRRFPFDGRIALGLALSSPRDIKLDLIAEAVEGGLSREALITAIAGLAPRTRAVMFARLRQQPRSVERLLRGGAVLALADLALRCGHVRQAEDWLRRASELRRANSARTAQQARAQVTQLPEDLLLGLLLDRGELAEAGRRLHAELSQAERDFGQSDLRERFAPLFARPGEELFVPASALDAERLLDALLRIGQGELVERLAPGLAERFPAAATTLTSYADEARRFGDFYDRVLMMLSPVDREGRSVLGSGMQKALDQLRELSQDVLGSDVVGTPRLLSFPLAGTFLDPFGPGLPEWFARHGRYLLLGQLMGEPVGALIGPKLGERRLEPIRGLQLAVDSREVVLRYKEFVSFQRLDTTSVAGLAIWNHFLLDADSAARWTSGAWLQSERYGQVDGAVAPSGPVVAALCFDRPCQVDWRILFRLRNDRGWDRRRMFREVLRLLRLHERAHLVDAQRYLPVTSHLGGAFSLFVRAGFSFEGLLANLEMRAECAALAYGADPQLTLAHIAEFHRAYLRGARTQHAKGFSELARRLVEKWAADGAPGARDPKRNLMAQLDAMPDEHARRYAGEILDQEDFRVPYEALLLEANASPASTR
jgi:tetratricopeptide (TPR) repeat protein